MATENNASHDMTNTTINDLRQSQSDARLFSFLFSDGHSCGFWTRPAIPGWAVCFSAIPRHSDGPLSHILDFLPSPLLQRRASVSHQP